MDLCGLKPQVKQHVPAPSVGIPRTAEALSMAIGGAIIGRMARTVAGSWRGGLIWHRLRYSPLAAGAMCEASY